MGGLPVLNKKIHSHISALQEWHAQGLISRREFIRQAALLGVTATTAYSLAGGIEANASDRPTAAELPRGGTLRIAQRCQELEKPHANINVEASNVIRQVYDYLTVTGVDNITRPSLCKRWEPSPDLKTWTLYLRDDVTFHNGRRFTADDVIWNLKRVLEPATGSSVLSLLAPFLLDEFETGETDDEGKAKTSTRLWDTDAIAKVDDFTVQLNGKTPQVAIPEYLFHYPLVMMDPEEGGVMKAGAANGTGAFELIEAEIGVRHFVKARPNYWAEGPYLDAIEFIDFGDDQSAQLAALASKQVEGIHLADPTMVTAFRGLPNAVMYTVATSQTSLVRMRPDVKPFDDVRVRQALRYATNNEELLQVVLHGIGEVGEHIHVGPMHPDYAEMPAFPYDPDRAKQLLTEAGYPDGIDLEITLKNVPWEQAAVELMVDQWSRVGIRCTLNIVPTPLYWERWLSLPFGFTSWSHRPLGVMLLALAYRSGVPWNETGWSNAEFDRLLNQAEGLVDPKARREVMLKLQMIMQEEGPIVLPLWPALVTFMDERVKGFRFHPTRYLFGNELALASPS
jgi:peptide/nickel transport system substrate-binding protein